MKRTGLMLTLIGAVLLYSGIASAQETYSLEEVLDNMERVGRDFRGFEATVEQDTVNVLVDFHTVKSGKVYLARRDDGSLLRMTLDDPPPAEELLVARGKLQLYQPRINLVQEFDLGENRNIAENLLVGFAASKADMLADYDITLVEEAVIDGVATSVIDLVPKSDRGAAMFATIRLWLDQQRWVPINVRTTEPGGNYRVQKFSDRTINGSIPDSVFELDLPKDVTVIKG